MKTENNLTYLLFAIGCLAALLLSIRFTPRYHEEIGVIQTDTGTYNHSEITIQELSETYLYYRQLESEREYRFDPKYLNTIEP